MQKASIVPNANLGLSSHSTNIYQNSKYMPVASLEAGDCSTITITTIISIILIRAFSVLDVQNYRHGL